MLRYTKLHLPSPLLRITNHFCITTSITTTSIMTTTADKPTVTLICRFLGKYKKQFKTGPSRTLRFTSDDERLSKLTKTFGEDETLFSVKAYPALYNDSVKATERELTLTFLTESYTNKSGETVPILKLTRESCVILKDEKKQLANARETEANAWEETEPELAEDSESENDPTPATE